MAITLDHLFIITEPGAPAADLLSDTGLVEGPSNSHPGQGTANRRFFFANSMLEFLYVRDAQEAARGPGRGLRITERASDLQASPFGIVARADLSDDVSFPAWRYFPEYFPPDQCFYVGENSDLLEEPLCVCLPVGQDLPPNRVYRSNPEFVVTDVRIGVSTVKASQTLAAFANCEGLSVVLDEPHHMELELNRGRSGILRDMRPALPLILRW